MTSATEPPPTIVAPSADQETPCRNCPLRPLKLFHEPTGDELELVQSLKRRERHLGAGESLIHEGQTDAAAHGVETLTDSLYCVFQRDALWELHRRSPMMGFNVTWLTAHEESMVDDTLLSVGRRSAEERIASLLILLFKRAAALQADAGAGGVVFPLTQQHIADG